MRQAADPTLPRKKHYTAKNKCISLILEDKTSVPSCRKTGNIQRNALVCGVCLACSKCTSRVQNQISMKIEHNSIVCGGGGNKRDREYRAYLCKNNEMLQIVN